MGVFDDALKNAVPGGNLTKPLIIAAGALILGKMLSGRSHADEPQADPTPLPAPTPQAAPQPTSPQQTADHDEGGLLDGLGGLLGKLRQGGLGDAADSWVGTGQNQQVQPGQLGQALGQNTIRDLAAKAGLNEQDLLNGLSQVLPGLIDKLTPNGRLPNQNEVGRGY